jgi:hypothetical protein
MDPVWSHGRPPTATVLPKMGFPRGRCHRKNPRDRPSAHTINSVIAIAPIQVIMKSIMLAPYE